MRTHLFILCSFFILSIVAAAARLPIWEPYGNPEPVDGEDDVALYSPELDDDELPTQKDNNNDKNVKRLTKRRYSGNSYPSYLPSAKVAQRQKIMAEKEDKLKGCDTRLNATLHSTMDCNVYTGCRVECEDFYVFPDGNANLVFICSDGQWVAEGTDYISVPECLPDEEESEEMSCEVYVPTQHSRANCPTDTFCELRCHRGYKFPANEKYVELTCEEGEWVAPEAEDRKVPVCEPEEPVCTGKPPTPPRTTLTCKSDRICEASCEKGYKFPSGESSVAFSCTAGVWTVQGDEEDGTKGCLQELLTCNGKPPRKLQNATIVCDDKRCTATCLEGHKFPSGNPTIDIVCRRNKWEITGTSWEYIPDCVQELKTITKCNGSQYLVFPNVGTYKVNTTHVSWPEAQKTCIHEGAHLAVIDSKEEVELMKELIAPHHLKNGWTYAHVGFNDLAKKGVWVTVLGSILDSVHFTRWAPRNPSKLNERCGAIDHKGRLHDIFCTSEQIFICEKV